MLPTITDLVGAPTPAGLDGHSLKPTLLGTGNQSQHEFLYWEFHEYGGSQAVRMGNWKGVRTHIHKGDSKVQLFDLATDISESHDVAAYHPEIAKQLMEIMTASHTKSDFPAWNFG
jgi:arylsulfatase A-like enzyme